MTIRHPPTKALVVLEALFYGIEVRFGDREFYIGSNSEDEPCVAAKIVMDDEDDDGNEIESECLMEVDFDLGDFLKESARLPDAYLTELAHRTALVKVQEELTQEK